MGQLQGLSADRASLFGMPHIGAAYRRSGGYAPITDRCLMCGRPVSNCHHVVPRSVREVFVLDGHELRSPLFALCGSGTTGCHDGFHGGARYFASWAWDDPRDEDLWWDGTLLRHYLPHDVRLYGRGRWEIEDRLTGRTVTYRDRP